ncbi:unnamed protein product, partial [Protopolystoma xenopodis]
AWLGLARSGPVRYCPTQNPNLVGLDHALCALERKREGQLLSLLGRIGIAEGETKTGRGRNEASLTERRLAYANWSCERGGCVNHPHRCWVDGTNCLRLISIVVASLNMASKRRTDIDKPHLA